MNLKKLILTALLVMTPLCANAAKSIDPNKSITRIGTYHTSAVIFFTPGQDNEQGCSDTRQDAVKIDLTTESGGKMLSTVLTAAAANKKIGFGVDGCLEGNLPKVYRVGVIF